MIFSEKTRSQAAAGQLYVGALGNLIIDDIHLPDGRQLDGRLGGSNVYATMGMAIWLFERSCLFGDAGGEGSGISLEHDGLDHRVPELRPLLIIRLGSAASIGANVLQGLDSLVKNCVMDICCATTRSNCLSDHAEDLGGIPLPGHPRALQVYRQETGERREMKWIVRLSPEILPQCSDVPDSANMVSCYFQTFPSVEVARQLRDRGVRLLLWEPNPPRYLVKDHQTRSELLDEFRKSLEDIDIFSPQIDEVCQLFGVHVPAGEEPRVWDGAWLRSYVQGSWVADLFESVLRLTNESKEGETVVALRMGGFGSLVGSRLHPYTVLVPSYQLANVVDVTGAGNTYCGGFLASASEALCRTLARERQHLGGPHHNGSGFQMSFDEMITAAVRATVSASFCVEQYGVPDSDSFRVNIPEAARRYEKLRSQVMVLPRANVMLPDA